MTDECATPRAPESWAANVVPDKMQLHTLALEVLTKLSKNPTFSTSDDGESELIVDSGEMRGQVPDATLERAATAVSQSLQRVAETKALFETTSGIYKDYNGEGTCGLFFSVKQGVDESATHIVHNHFDALCAQLRSNIHLDTPSAQKYLC
jgi:hypothetical protein